MERPRSDLVSERGTQVAVALARTGAITGTTSPSPATVIRDLVLAALREVPDPELPMVSIVDLGMVGAVEVAPMAPAGDGAIRVELLPTFIGCPALELIRSAVETRLAAIGPTVRVETVFRPPWSTDRITADALRALAEAGIAAPTDGTTPAACPWCGSGRTVMDSAFGPTQCRSLQYCRDCRQPFEALRLI